MTGRELDRSQTLRNYEAALRMYGPDHKDTKQFAAKLASLQEKPK